MIAVVSRGYLGGGGGPTDTTAPTAVVVNPPEGDTTSDATLVVDVTDDNDIGYVAVFALLNGSLEKEPVFRRGAFEPGYTLASYVEAVSGGCRLHIKRDAGWPEGDVDISFDPVDTAGNVGA